MYLDVTWFGYGVGLVLVGWAAGMVLGVVFKSLRAISWI